MQPTYVTQARHLPFNWRQETRRGYPIRTTCFLWESKKPEGVKFDSTTWFYETKKSWVNFDISVIPKNAIKNNTSQSLSLIAKGIPSKPPINFIIKPFLKSPHNMI
jgi:hypothetical protein